MISLIPKKILIIFVILLLVFAMIWVVTPSSGDTVKAPFGSWRVEIIGLGCCGQKLEFTPSGIMGDVLEFTKDGSTVEQVQVNIYATPTGSGFDSVEFDLSKSTWDYNCPSITPSLLVGNTVYNYDAIDYDGDVKRVVDIGEEVLFHQGTILLEDIFTLHPEINKDTDQTMSLDIMFTLWECTYRGLSQQGDGPWQTDQVSFTVRSDVLLDWSSEDSCGDGTCLGEPYPGENCKSCPGDCGSCNAKILPGDRTLEVSSGLVEDIWGIQRNYMTDSGSWDGWTGSQTNWEHIEVFENENQFSTFVYYDSSLIGRTLYANCLVRPVGTSAWTSLPDTSWSENGVVLDEDHVGYNSGDGFVLGWTTETNSDHHMPLNGNWELKVSAWLSSGGNGPAEFSNPGPSDGTTVNTGFVPLELYVVDPDGDSVSCTFYWYETGTSTVPIGTDSVVGEGYVYNDYFVNNPLSDGTYLWSVTGTDEDGEVTFSDIFSFTVNTGGMSMVTTGFFDIRDESRFGAYSFDDKWLGE